MNELFALLNDYTFQVVAVGTAVLGIVSGVIGSFAVLRKQSLLGDGVSHSALPGVIAAFLITGVKTTHFLLLGAFITGLLSTFLIILISKYSRIKFDSALAISMSVFFGLGLVLLTYSQKIPNANQAGLNRFIYGQASTLLKSEVIFTMICAFFLFALVILFYKEFKLVSFDPDFAQTLGFPVKKLEILLSIMTVIAIIIGLQTVGVILMSAMLIAPAVAARQWCSRLSSMLILSAVFGASSGIIGTVISSKVNNMPTGPIIVVCISCIVFFSILFAPNRGLLHKMYTRHSIRKKRELGGSDVSAN